MGTLDLLFGGGGGGIFCAESIFFLCFIYRYFGFAVLVLEVCSFFYFFIFLVVPHIGRVLFLALHAVVGSV